MLKIDINNQGPESKKTAIHVAYENNNIAAINLIKSYGAEKLNKDLIDKNNISIETSSKNLINHHLLARAARYG